MVLIRNIKTNKEMKIRLCNFKCYNDTTFEFGTSGLVLISGSSGAGKCLGKDTPVLMYDGTIKSCQDIQIGDVLMGDDSLGRAVLATCEGYDELYEIKPMKGRSYIVNSKHVLTLKCIEKQETRDICIQEYMKLSKTIKDCNYTFHTGVEFREKLVEMNPYLLGVWLGGNTSSESTLSIVDGKVLNKISKILESYDLEPREYLKCNYKIVEKSSSNECHNKIFRLLKDYNILNNKHIPYVYKTNSKNVRLNLLAGIIDSKGYVHREGINIMHDNIILANDIEYLAFSLGFMVVRETIMIETDPPTGPYELLTIYGSGLDTIPIQKSHIYLYTVNHDENATMQKFDIIPQGIGKYYGFELSGNGRFLLGDFTVTHNSSIFNGIHFALYGSGTDIIADGKTSCSVELEFDDLIVNRTKRPNRLVVKENDIEYEDDAGQDIIVRRFGNTFETCGYISQDSVNSFITMSPIEKLSFLEKFAFRDINLLAIKTRCKNLIKETNDDLVSITSKMDMIKSVFDDMSKPAKIEFPLKCSKNLREKAVKNENIRYSNSLILIKKKIRTIKQLRTELKDLAVYKTFLEGKSDIVKRINTKLSKLLSEEVDINYEGDEELEKYQSQFDYLMTCRELISLESKFSENLTKLEEMRQREIETNKQEIENITNKLWIEYTKDELRESLDDCKLCLEDMEMLNKLQLELKRYKTREGDLEDRETELYKLRIDIESKKDTLSRIKLEQYVYSCPVCETKLHLTNEELCVVDSSYEEASEEDEIEDIEHEIRDMSIQINRLERLIPELRNKRERYDDILCQIQNIKEQYEDIPSILSLKDDIEYLRKYESSQIELEKKKKALENIIKSKTFSVAITTFEKDIDKQRKRISELRKHTKKITVDKNEDELKSIIETQKRYKFDLRRIRNEKRELNDEKTCIEDEIEEETDKYISTYSEVRDECELKDKLTVLEQELSELEDKRDTHTKNLKAIEKYTENQKEILKYREWQEKLKTVTNDEKKAQEKYAAAISLKEKILEAESIAMLNVIMSINTHAQVYLDEFFPINPISVRLASFKETKKTTKPQINIEIEYKGREAGISRLSGGEKSRVVLAFTLALADMFNIPMIMLDECTSSLDQELNGVVIDSLHEHFSNKLVLIIAHQVITGVFDKIITLKEDSKPENNEKLDQ